MPASRNLRVYNAHKLHHTARQLPCPFSGCNRTFTRISARTQHIRKIHPEQLPEDLNPICNLSPNTQADPHLRQGLRDDALSNVEFGVDAHSGAQSPSLHGGRDTPEIPTSHAHPFEFGPFSFEWDENENDSYNYDYDDYDSNNDSYGDLRRPWSPQASSNRQDPDEEYEEWDERHGWGPYTSDNDNDNSSDDPEKLPTPEPQSRRREPNAAPPVTREYHDSINGKYSNGTGQFQVLI